MADGSHVLPLATSQDHKRLKDADRGPNTGGMGAYSPAPVVTPVIHARIMREVIEPTIRGLAAEGMPYTGFLYAGIMVAEDGTPNVLEFNCRFGDPETQPILMRLQTDLTTLCEAALDGRLDQVQATWDPRAALGVVMAAEGYPDHPRLGSRRAPARQDLSCRHAAQRGSGPGQWRARAMRDRDGRHGGAGAEGRLRPGRYIALAWCNLPPGYRAPRIVIWRSGSRHAWLQPLDLAGAGRRAEAHNGAGMLVASSGLG